MNSYYEIAGHVLEYEYADQVQRPAANPVIEYAKQRGVPPSVTRAALKQASGEIGYDLVKGSQGIGHAKRAAWAASRVLALAAADGPLPFGDILAGGVLVWYGYHEGKMAIEKIMQ